MNETIGRAGTDGNPSAEQLRRRVRIMRLGFFGTFGLYGMVFIGVQLVYYLWGRLLGLPGVYRAEGVLLGLTAGAWIVTLLLPGVVCYLVLRKQDERNRETLTRSWNAWKWFDHGVEMFETDLEFSDEQGESFARSCDLDPNDPYARNNLGAVLWHQGLIDEAMQFYEDAIKRNPEYYKAYSNLGAAYARKGDPERAIGLYRKALKLNPRDAATHLNLGLALARLGKATQAGTHLKQFLTLAPDHARAGEVKQFVNQMNLSRAG
jgi:tetratricopeptide (TPR) repeat protein